MPFKNVKGSSTPVPSPTGTGKDAPSNGRSARGAAKPNGVHPPATAPLPAMVKPKQTVSSKAVLDSVAKRPRYYLGDVVYQPKLKAARMQDPLTGLPPRFPYSSTPKPLPMDMIQGKENCTLTVKVSKVYLTSSSREEITHRRALWGTDVYTDDSDVVAACIHGGWLRGEWHEDVDTDYLDLDEGIGPGPRPPRGNSHKWHRRPVPAHMTEPPLTGPVIVPDGKDLHVHLLVLPLLEKYASTTRFGIQSREWGSKQDGHQPHDGLSFMVESISWVTNGAGAQSRLRGKARRERMRQAMQEVEIPSLAGIERALRNEAMGKKAEKEDSKTNGNSGDRTLWKPSQKEGSDGDKENRPINGNSGDANDGDANNGGDEKQSHESPSNQDREQSHDEAKEAQETEPQAAVVKDEPEAAMAMEE